MYGHGVAPDECPGQIGWYREKFVPSIAGAFFDIRGQAFWGRGGETVDLDAEKP